MAVDDSEAARVDMRNAAQSTRVGEQNAVSPSNVLNEMKISGVKC